MLTVSGHARTLVGAFEIVVWRLAEGDDSLRESRLDGVDCRIGFEVF